MDNFSQENDEKELKQNESKVEDIKFDDNIDIDKIEQKLIEKIKINEDGDDDVTELLDQSSEFEFNENKTKDIEDSSIDEPQPSLIDTKAKKYVIYIDAENIDFMENLSIPERRTTINKILKEQNEIAIKAKKEADRAKFLKHLSVAGITFLIAFPVLFFLANISTEITITNYRQAKKNFEKLYKQGGKIKQVNSESVTDFKY